MPALTVEAARAALQEAEAAVASASEHVDRLREEMAEGTTKRPLVERARRDHQKALDREEEAKAALRVAVRRAAEEAREQRDAIERAKAALGRQARIRYGETAQRCADLAAATGRAFDAIRREFEAIEPEIGRGGANWPLGNASYGQLARGLSDIQGRATEEVRRFAGARAG
jgi:hypothetical protein